MKSPYSFIVRASGGNRYVGSKDIEGVDFIVNTSEENHKASNRIAVVVSTPVNYNGDIQVTTTTVWVPHCPHSMAT